jgi:spore coat protein U-like protein
MSRAPAEIAAICSILIAAPLSLSALAQKRAPAGTTTRTATFMVSVMVDNDCLISGSDPLNFGHLVPRLGANTEMWFAQTDRPTRFSVSCTKNTRYTLYLDQGSVANSTVNARLMVGNAPGNADQLRYQLYLDPACSIIWGDGSSGSASNVGGVGNGGPQVYTVYGRILPQDVPNADLYSSMITASLTF